MRNINSILAGWALTFGAVISSISAFPAIADKADTHRDTAEWQSRAVAFAAVSEGADFENSYAEALAETFSDTPSTHVQRVTVATSDLTVSVKPQLASVKMQEAKCLAEAIYYEARSQSYAGQKAVAEVVQNRVKSKHYPNSICGVVYEGSERVTGCQFSFTCDGSMDKAPRGRHWEKSQSIAKLSIMGGYTKFMGRATHYHTHEVNPPWAKNLHSLGDVGDHTFYRFRWRERKATPSISVAPPI